MLAACGYKCSSRVAANQGEIPGIRSGGSLGVREDVAGAFLLPALWGRVVTGVCFALAGGAKPMLQNASKP